MFFAETLGPALTPRSGEALFQFVQAKLRGRRSVPAAELRETLAEFVRRDGGRISVEGAIQYLTARGRITVQDARTYRIAG